MKCPQCGGDNNRVLRTTKFDATNERRLECKDCGHRWNTQETLKDNSETFTARCSGVNH